MHGEVGGSPLPKKTRPGTGANTKWLGEARPLLYRGGTCVPELHVSAGISDGAGCLVLHILVHLAVLLTGGHCTLVPGPMSQRRGQDESRSLILDSSLPLLLHIVQEVEIEIALSARSNSFSLKINLMDSA